MNSDSFSDSESDQTHSDYAPSTENSVSSATGLIDDDEELINTANYQLKDLSKKSNHKIWEHFGTLCKLNRVVSKTRDRIFCRRCFEKKSFKR